MLWKLNICAFWISFILLCFQYLVLKNLFGQQRNIFKYMEIHKCGKRQVFFRRQLLFYSWLVLIVLETVNIVATQEWTLHKSAKCLKLVELWNPQSGYVVRFKVLGRGRRWVEEPRFDPELWTFTRTMPKEPITLLSIYLGCLTHSRVF